MKEFSYLKWIQKQLKYPPEVFIKSGDDAAGIKIDKKHFILLTCDSIVEGVDFLLPDTPNIPNQLSSDQYATAYQIGYKALAVSLSDIAAMGGLVDKLYAVVTLALRKGSSSYFTCELFRGIKTVANKFKVTIVGGDITSTNNGPISIGVTLVGIGKLGNKLIQRSGAQVGDAIMVTGTLGGSILGKHLTFTPRLKEARILARKYRVNAMIDISDGLLKDLHHILQASNKGSVLFEASIPISKAAKKMDSPLQHALSDGEDFELLFTLPMQEANRLLKTKPFKTKVSLIGTITSGNGIFLKNSHGKIKKVIPSGFEHKW